MHNHTIFNISYIWPFIHILSGVIFISIQISILRSAVRIIRYDKNLKELINRFESYERFFIFFVILSATSGILISIGKDKFSDPLIEAIIYTKIVVIILLLINYAFMKMKMINFKKSLLASDDIQTTEISIIVFKYFMSLNILLAIVAVYLGVVISEF